MSGPYFADRFNTADRFERTNEAATIPAVNSDPFADVVASDPAVLHETPMGGTVAAVAPLNEPLPAVVPLFETPLQEIPMGGTVAPAGPMYEPAVEVVPVDEMTTPAPQVSEPVVYSAPVNEMITSAPLVSEQIHYVAPVSEPMTPAAPIAVVTTPTTLFNHEDSEHLRTRWNEIQGQFVDEPRTAVQQADALVSEVVDQIAQMFAKEHSSLESQWHQGNDVSTEDLRKALQHYRSFFNRLVV